MAVLLKHGADMQNILDSEKPANEIRRKISSSFFGDAASARSDASLPYTSEDERRVSEFKMAAARKNNKDSIKDISIKILLHEAVGTKTQRVVVYPLPGDQAVPAVANLTDFYELDTATFFEEYGVANFSIVFADYLSFYTQHERLSTVIVQSLPAYIELSLPTAVVSMN